MEYVVTAMIWADRIALLWAGLVVATLWWATNDNTIGLIQDLVSFEGFRGLAILVMPVWLFLRLLHFVFGGRLDHGPRRP